MTWRRERQDERLGRVAGDASLLASYLFLLLGFFGFGSLNLEALGGAGWFVEKSKTAQIEEIFAVSSILPM